MIAAATFGFISYLVGNVLFADYLQIHFVQGTGELAVICGALVGAGLGFLWFNAPPALIFMGDTGSLALGGALGTIAVATKHELVLAIVGGLFVLEAASVIVQVTSFQLFGKRVFRMAPLHHHFEQKGWPESTVVIRFWIICRGACACWPRHAEIALNSSIYDSRDDLRRPGRCGPRPWLERLCLRPRAESGRRQSHCLGRQASAREEQAASQGFTVRDLASADWSGFAALVLAPGIPLTHPEPHWSVSARARTPASR